MKHPEDELQFCLFAAQKTPRKREHEREPAIDIHTTMEIAEQVQDKSPDVAARLYQQVLTVDAGNSTALLNLGYVLSNQGKHEEAEALYRRAVELAPRFKKAHFNLACALEELGRPDEALQHYEIAISLDPLYGDALYNAALLIQRMHWPHRDAKALRYFQTYCHLDPKSAWGQQAALQIRNIVDGSDLSIVYSNPKPKRTGLAERPQLFLVKKERL